MDSWNPGQAASSRLAGSRTVQGAILVILFSLLSLQDAAAHDPGLSSLTIRQRTNSLAATLTLAVRDAAQLAELDKNHDGIVTQAEFAQTRSQLERAVARQLFIAADGKIAKDGSIHSRLDGNNNVEVCLNFHAIGFSSLEIQSKILAFLPLGHRQYLQIQNSPGETIFEQLLSAAADRATVQMPHTNARYSAVRSRSLVCEFSFSGCETYFDRIRSFALSLRAAGRGGRLFLFVRYYHFIYDRALDHTGSGNTAARANSKSNCGATDRCFHRFCWHREPFARRHSESAANGALRLWFDTWLRLCFGFT